MPQPAHPATWQFVAHVTPLIKQMLELHDKGHDASLIMPLPPVLIFWGKEEVSKQTPKADAIGGHGLEDGEVAYVSCVDLRGDGSKADPGAPGREARSTP